MGLNRAGNVRISPVNVYWEIESQGLIDLSSITSFDGTSFWLYEPDGTKVIVAFDLDAGSTLPTPGSGERLLEVDVLTADTLAQKATKLQAAIDGDGNFTAEVPSGETTKVLYTHADVGEVTDPADDDSGATLTACRRGKNLDLGLLQGEPELSTTVNNFILTTQQTGLIPQAALFQGAEVSVGLELLETQSSKLSEFFRIYGGKFTPGGGTEVFGIGSNKVGANLLVDAARLRMSPVTPANDNLGNVNLMLAIPTPDSLVFSGENPRVLSTTWQGFLDESIDDRVNQLLVGDATQAGL